MALNSELEVLRRDLQRMTLAREEAEAVTRGKERELQTVTSHLGEARERLKRSEDCQKKLERKIRLIENASRNPDASFLLWCKDKRHEVCDAHPTASTAELLAIMRADWRTASVEDRNRYNELHITPFLEKYMLVVASQAKMIETDPTEEHSADIDDDSQEEAMSLLDEYLASKKARITETGVEVYPETSASSTSAEVREDAQSSIRLELLGNHLKTAREDPSAYLLFRNELRQIPHRHLNAYVARKWQELSPGEKRIWHDKGKAAEMSEAIAKDKMDDIKNRMGKDIFSPEDRSRSWVKDKETKVKGKKHLEY